MKGARLGSNLILGERFSLWLCDLLHLKVARCLCFLSSAKRLLKSSWGRVTRTLTLTTDTDRANDSTKSPLSALRPKEACWMRGKYLHPESEGSCIWIPAATFNKQQTKEREENQFWSNSFISLQNESADSWRAQTEGRKISLHFTLVTTTFSHVENIVELCSRTETHHQHVTCTVKK